MRKLVLIVMILLLSFSNLSCISLTISEREKQLLFTVDDIIDYQNYEWQGIRKCETYYKFGFNKLFRLYNYSFDSDKEKKNDKYLNISSSVKYYYSVAAAKQGISTDKTSFKFGFNLAGKSVGVKMEKADHLFTLGDENYHFFIKNKNSTVGNWLVTRIGKKVVQVTLIGLYFDDRELFEECLTPTIENIKKFD